MKLKEEMEHLDKLIEESADSGKCQSVFSSHYGSNKSKGTVLLFLSPLFE